jgi:hypothetical protein
MSNRTPPTHQSTRAISLRRALDGLRRADHRWVEAVMTLATELAAARQECGDDDTAFGGWLDENDFDDLDHDTRAALIHMAAHPDVSRYGLAQTRRRSIRLIWEREIRPRTAPPTPVPEPTETGDLSQCCERSPPPTPPAPSLPPVSVDEMEVARAAEAARQTAMAAAFRRDRAVHEQREQQEQCEQEAAAVALETTGEQQPIQMLVEALQHPDMSPELLAKVIRKQCSREFAQDVTVLLTMELVPSLESLKQAVCE